MARPRVFVSSTYYDLRTLREDLDRFVRSLGYEPVRHERGHISYGKEERPEEFAYKEIEFCEILICIIGGRFGSTSSNPNYSITQKELKTALDSGKQVYIFVEEAVHYEHRHYLANKGVSGIKFTAVDNVKIHEFLEEIYALPKGNPVFPFGVSSDITSILSEQWAGLFQRLLIENANKSQMQLIEELQRSLQTAGELVQFLSDQKGIGDQAIREILLSNHPLFSALRDLLGNGYRIYFKNYRELDEWLRASRNYSEYEDPFDSEDKFFEWSREIKPLNQNHFLGISRSLFDENLDLKPILPGEWDDKLIKLERVSTKRASPRNDVPFDDDIPF